MSGPAVSVRLADRRRRYRSGDALSGVCQIESWRPEEIKAVEISVIWFTEGKGDEDEGLHHFQRRAEEEGPFASPAEIPFCTEPLPASPQSYDGQILKIRWCVRVQVFLPHRETLVYDEPFQLGDIPPSLPAEAPAA